MKPFSLDLRQRVLADYHAGLSFAQLGRKYTTSAEWARQFIRRHQRRRQATGEVSARPPVPKRPPFHRRHEAALRAAVAAQPDVTLDAPRARLGLAVSTGTPHNALRALKPSVKKKTLVAAEQARPDVAAGRAEVRAAQRVGLDPDRFAFLDETCVKTDMTRLYGRWPRGERLVEHVPHGHWLTATFVGAPRSTGLVAPPVAGGATNGAIFRAWVEQQLVRARRPGDIVVMDNLAAHKVAGVRAAIDAADAAVVDRPPYSPDLNPIENVFAKVKNEMRERKPRTKAACDDLCGECPDWFPAAECHSYFRHAGYAPQDSD